MRRDFIEFRSGAFDIAYPLRYDAAAVGIYTHRFQKRYLCRNVGRQPLSEAASHCDLRYRARLLLADIHTGSMHSLLIL